MNILIFGPNGSGKGTQSDLIKDVYSLEHIESGDIFRGHIDKGTELGKRASQYMEKGELVPDEITVPMVLETLKGVESRGWLLDGFPRNVEQAESLLISLMDNGSNLDIVVELLLDRQAAKNRIMGRRICTTSSHHPNNIYIEAIAPDNDRCRVCGASLTKRDDDQDEDTINQRHDIYYDGESGTLAAVAYFVNNSSARHLQVDAGNSIDEIKEELLSLIAG
jgi:adenylate kinase